MSKTRQLLLADLSLVFITFVWGATFTVVKGALRDIHPIAFLAFRFTLAALIIFPLILSTKRLKTLPVLSGIISGIFLFFGYLAQTVGLQYTTASKSAFITGLSVVMVPVFAAVFERKRLTIRVVIAILIAVGGLYLLTNPQTGTFNRGDLWTLFCALAFALHIISLEYYTRRVDFVGFYFMQIVTVSVVSLVAYPFESDQFFFIPAGITVNVIWALIVTAVFATAIAYFIQNWAQSITTSSRTALILTLEPLFAALTAYVILGETLGVTGMIGGILILGAILLSEIRFQER